MQAGTLVDSDVKAYTSRVLVNGVQRPHKKWSVDRELSGDLPAQVVSVSGITQATGTIEWAAESNLDDGSSNPWNKSTGWIPSKGDRVEIFAGDGTTEWKQFHGVIDRTTGSIGGGFQSTLIDDYDKLSVPVSHAAMLRVMPPLASDGSEPYRSAGLHPLYYVDRALRTAGFYCTPRRENDAALYVPLQGSRWPHYGNLKSSTDFANTVTPWGLGARDGTASWLPASTKTMSAATQLTLMVAPGHASTTDVFLDYGSATDHLRLSVNSARVAISLKNGAEVCRVSLGAATLVSMLAKGGAITLRTELGAEASGAFTASGSAMSLVRLSAGANSSVAGLQVSHPAIASHDHFSTRWIPSAVLDTTSLQLAGILDAAPVIEGGRADDLLDEINGSVLAGMWIDELGVMRWASSDTLRGKATARTVTTLNDILSLDWEDGLLASASSVRVTGRKPAITKGRWKNLVLARGGGDTMKSGDELTIVLEPESDEDWINPSGDFIEVGGSGGIWGSYNNPSYSATGLYYSADGGTTTVAGLTCTITTQSVGLQKFLVKYMAGTWPSDVEGVVATSPTAATLWPKNRNQDLPRLVGRGKVQWMDEEVTATGAGGPGPALVHDAGYWANRTDSTEMLDRYASYLQSQTATPKPTITGLEIVYDPRLQLGDVITIDSPDLMGINITALIVGISNSTGGTFAQSLSVRIITATSTFQTFAEFNAAMPGSKVTFQQWDALGPKPQTFAGFNTNI